MSAERTLMSWVRTGVSLIEFGFTIFQFFERFSGMERVTPAARPDIPWYLGRALIAAGTIGLIVAAWEYRFLLRYLWGTEFQPIAGLQDTPWRTPVFPITLALILVGIFAFLTGAAASLIGPDGRPAREDCGRAGPRARRDWRPVPPYVRGCGFRSAR
jgi:putative membrane protein